MADKFIQVGKKVAIEADGVLQAVGLLVSYCVEPTGAEDRILCVVRLMPHYRGYIDNQMVGDHKMYIHYVVVALGNIREY